MDIDVNGKFRLYNFASDSIQDSISIEGDFNNDSTKLVYTPLGDIILERNKMCQLEGKTTINVRQIGINNASTKLGGKLSFGTSGNSKINDIINISITDSSIERADDILETIIQVYNENWVYDKNKAASGTAAFIEKRLEKVSSELNKIESDISTFKSDNQMPDLNQAIAKHMSKEKEST